jgi:hypothetical protein
MTVTFGAIEGDMSGWQPIETAPKDEMFVWAAPDWKRTGKWKLGLAYRNVSGGWSDAYGAPAPEYATHWWPLPAPPQGFARREREGNAHQETPRNPCVPTGPDDAA